MWRKDKTRSVQIRKGTNKIIKEEYNKTRGETRGQTRRQTRRQTERESKNKQGEKRDRKRNRGEIFTEHTDNSRTRQITESNSTFDLGPPV